MSCTRVQPSSVHSFRPSFSHRLAPGACIAHHVAHLVHLILISAGRAQHPSPIIRHARIIHHPPHPSPLIHLIDMTGDVTDELAKGLGLAAKRKLAADLNKQAIADRE